MPLTTTSKYPAEVFWSDEDEGFIAIASDLPGCTAWGKDDASAIQELRSAIEAWIESAKAAGNPVPPPSNPAATDRYSGKFLLRVPRELHANLARDAKKEDVSLNQYVVYLLTHSYAVRMTEQRWTAAQLTTSLSHRMEPLQHFRAQYLGLGSIRGGAIPIRQGLGLSHQDFRNPNVAVGGIAALKGGTHFVIPLPADPKLLAMDDEDERTYE